eukprot:4305141-Prorocentrum_lima.AAC.1
MREKERGSICGATAMATAAAGGGGGSGGGAGGGSTRNSPGVTRLVGRGGARARQERREGRVME